MKEEILLSVDIKQVAKDLGYNVSPCGIFLTAGGVGKLNEISNTFYIGIKTGNVLDLVEMTKDVSRDKAKQWIEETYFENVTERSTPLWIPQKMLKLLGLQSNPFLYMSEKDAAEHILEKCYAALDREIDYLKQAKEYPPLAHTIAKLEKESENRMDDIRIMIKNVQAALDVFLMQEKKKIPEEIER